MNRKVLFFTVILASLVGGVISLGGFVWLFGLPNSSNSDSVQIRQNHLRFSDYEPHTTPELNRKLDLPQNMNFVPAVEKIIASVVQLKIRYEGYDYTSSEDGSDILDWFRDNYDKDDETFSSGSGVIIREDGYIITNFHVVEEAEKIDVILQDKRKFQAEIIGTDPNTDLALLKIKAIQLPQAKLGNSDEIKVGEWVLAVGNPFDLTSTVTAGIISAKSRSINILQTKDNLAVESFIQTDAAVNPGNSGGALVNLNGELIGINTAIATGTGSFSGYSFAVPSRIVKKTAQDLIEFGQVQRALLGVSVLDISADLMESKDLNSLEGVYVAGITRYSAAEEAGLQVGDIITKINDNPIHTVSRLQEITTGYKPGNVIFLTYEREGNTKTVKVILKNKYHTTELVSAFENKVIRITELGADFAVINRKERKKYGIKHGVKVVRLQNGKLKKAEVQTGFIVTHVDKTKITTVADLQEILRGKSGGVLIEGITPTGDKAFYGIGF